MTRQRGDLVLPPGPPVARWTAIPGGRGRRTGLESPEPWAGEEPRLILRAPFGMTRDRETAVSARAPFQIDGHGLVFFAVLLAVALAGEVLVLRPLVIDPEVPVSGIDVVFGLVGGSFAISGLVAWHKRPDSYTGVLMTATGFAFFVSPLLRQVDGALAFTVWSLLVDLWIFFYVPLLLTLLTRGRMRTRVEPLAAGRLRRAARAAAGRLDAVRRARGRQPAAGVPRRGRRARARPRAALPAARGAGRDGGGDRGPLVAGLDAAAAGAAAEHRRRVHDAHVRRAARQRPRDRRALGAAAVGDRVARC